MFNGIPYMNKQDRAPAPGNNRGPQQQRNNNKKKGKAKGGSKNQSQPRSIPAAIIVPSREKSVPSIRTSARSCRVVHTEFFQDVMGTTSGYFIRHRINPSKSDVFPWLSQMANLWEHYKFNSLRFRYTPTVGTTTNGTFAMAPDYDGRDNFPSSKSEILTYDDKAHCMAYGTCVVNCSKQNISKGIPGLFTGETPVGADVNLYDVCSLFYYTNGMAGTTQVGELYVEYDVTFSTPQAYKSLNPYGVGGSFSGTTNVSPFGTVGAFNNMISSGTMEAAVSTGTFVSQTTFTFLKPWTGFVSTSFTGTGLTTIQEAGSVDANEIWTEIGYATQIANCFQIRAAVGQYYRLTIGNNTLDNCKIIFGEAPYNYA